MQEFLALILSLPTVIYTVLIALVLAYWLTVIVGALDVDLFDIDADLDVDVDMDLDIDVDVDLDVDVDVDVDVELGVDGMDGAGADVGGDAPEIGGFAGALHALGLTGVPLTVTLSIFILYNWVFTFLGVYALKAMIHGLVGWAIVGGLFLGSFAVGLLTTSITIRPLRNALKTEQSRQGAATIVGSVVTVTSGTVTATLGRGLYDESEPPLELQLRCEEPNTIKRGDRVLLVDYDDEAHTYLVEPYDAMLGTGRHKAHDAEREIIFAHVEAEATAKA